MGGNRGNFPIMIQYLGTQPQQPLCWKWMISPSWISVFSHRGAVWCKHLTSTCCLNKEHDTQRTSIDEQVPFDVITVHFICAVLFVLINPGLSNFVHFSPDVPSIWKVICTQLAVLAWSCLCNNISIEEKNLW